MTVKSATTSSVQNSVTMDTSAAMESSSKVAKIKSNDNELLDSSDFESKDDGTASPLVRKHSNDPSKLVSTSLLRKLGEADKVIIEEEEKSKDLSLADSAKEEGANKCDKNKNDGRPNLSDGPKTESSFRTEWITEQMNTSYGRRSWSRECLDSVNQWRYNCGMLVNNPNVQLFIIFLIGVNAAMMGLATFDFINENPKLDEAFETADQVFLVIFTIELGMQFIYHGLRLLFDGWLVFDLIIIVTSWMFSEVQVIRSFRIFRALRLVTRIKTLKNLVLALFGVMPRMAAIGLMLCLIFYIFGVMFTQLFKDLYEDGMTEHNYFGGLSWTFFTLFQIMTLDNWAPICREVTHVYIWAWLPFTAFVTISGFIVVNLIIAVICDAIGALHADEKAKLHGDYDEEGTDAGDSNSMDIREQLDTLEDQVEDLTRIQARTFHTLQYLTQQMQMHKLKQELQTQSFAAAASQLKKVQSQRSQRNFGGSNLDGSMDTSPKFIPHTNASIEVAALKDG